jgi:parallel beta-helix repeat protein
MFGLLTSCSDDIGIGSDESDLDSEANGDTTMGGSRLLSGSPHANITIANDTDFADQALLETWDGDGSEGTPYIIEGYDIDMASGFGRCIEIKNTRVHFVIQDCYLTGATQTQGIGVLLENVTNARILRNTIDNCWRGIHLATSWNISVEENTCSASDLVMALVLSHNNTVVDSSFSDGVRGIHLDTSHQNDFDNNTCSNNGIGVYFGNSNLNNITNSNCSSNSEKGIELSSTTQNLIFNNTLADNVNEGMYIGASTQTTIAYNEFSSNTGAPVVLWQSFSNTIANNTIQSWYKGSLAFIESGNNVIVGNNMSHGGISLRLYFQVIGQARQALVANNTIGGRPIVFLQDQVGGTVPQDAGNVLLVNCSQVTVGNLTVTNASIGIQMNYCDDILIENCTVSSGTVGIYLDVETDNSVSRNNTVVDCEVGYTIFKYTSGNKYANSTSINNTFGILFQQTGSGNWAINNTVYDGEYGLLSWSIGANTYTNNTCHNNDYGVFLRSDSSSNSITWNAFVNNTVDAEDAGSSNSFDYNYYSDYVGVDEDNDGLGDTSYPIDGTSPAIDTHPLFVPLNTHPIWLHSFDTQFLEEGAPFYYDANATATYPGITTWWTNMSATFSIGSTGVIQNITPLPVVDFGVWVRAYDDDLNVADGILPISVSPSAPPTWVDTPLFQTIDEGGGFSFDLNATDISGLHTWWLINTTYFSIDQNGVFANTTPLGLGLYVTLVYVNDTLGNTQSYSVEFVVAEAAPPTWDEIPVDQYVYPWTALNWDLNASDTSGIDTWWVNDTVNFAIDANGVLTNATTLTHGNYDVGIFVNDTYGNTLSHTLTVFVDLIAPYIHTPIAINGDADFVSTAQKEGWQGDGTIGNPFIIENWHIDVTGLSVDSIEIRNTNVYFTIRYCLFIGEKVYFRFGVDLVNVDNGTLSNNTFIALHRGIQLETSNYNLIINNTCFNSTYGIRLVNSNEWNDIVNNTCNECWRSIELWTGSDNNNVRGNFVTNGESAGINIEGCSYITVENNTVDNCLSGINSYNSAEVEIINNTCSGSSTGINIGWCERFTVLDNTFFLNSRGISISESNWSHFINNSITDQLQMGISIDSNCHNNVFTNNTSIRNQYGIRVWFGNCVNNSFYWNVLVNSTIDDAYDVGTDSVFDYNHYSEYSGTDSDRDWIGDTSHLIEGGVGTLDLHPLMYPRVPFEWNASLAERNFEVGAHILVYVDTDPPAPAGSWWINDTVDFVIDAWGVISNVTPLSLGTYGIEVRVTNIYGTLLTAVFDIVINTGAPPTWVETPIDQLIEYGQALLYDLDATDPSGIDSWWIDDTLRFTIDWQGRLRNATTLTPDDYGVEIFVSDIHGNTQSARIVIQVRDTTPPDWTIPINDIVITYGSPFEYQLSAWDLSGIGSWEVNDTAQFAIDETGRITNRIVLPIGEYDLAVTVNDTYGNSRTANIAVTVEGGGPVLPDLTQVLTLAAIAGSVIGAIFAVMALASLYNKRKVTQLKEKQKEDDETTVRDLLDEFLDD